MNKQKRSPLKSIGLGLAVVAGILFYAYGFEVTNVGLEETRNPARQTSLQRVLRALAHPEIFEYDREEFIVSTNIWTTSDEIPCPVDEASAATVDESGPYIVLDPPCVKPKGRVVIEGFGFEPNTRGPINLMPPSGVTLNLGTAEADSNGHFQTIIDFPNRQPLEDAQEIRITTRQNVGAPHFTKTAYETWDKIVETVFMALLATTFGTLLAVPISFFAARNLMKEVTSPLISAALSVIFWPIGVLAGFRVSEWIASITEIFSNGLPMLGGLVVAGLVAWLVLRFSIPESDEEPSLFVRLTRFLLLAVGIFIFVLAMRLFTEVAFYYGEKFAESMGSFAFIATFVSDLGELLQVVVNVGIVLGVGVFFGTLGSRLGHLINGKAQKGLIKVLNFPIAALAGAEILVVLGFIIDWFYQFNNPTTTIWWPAAVGAILGLLFAFRAWQEDVVSTGLAIYYLSRTILNALRSIEALIMAIVFVVWVSIGPFAGVLALALHTIVSLAKLYSEQVESISTGPLEAVKATGANRLQMIIYSVIPQIVPPYIAFTIYRWDINVRMSTIIGFAGGGGIGSLLLQNINLLNYRAAAAQMLAIAIVVASMDYISSVLRERVI